MGTFFSNILKKPNAFKISPDSPNRPESLEGKSSGGNKGRLDREKQDSFYSNLFSISSMIMSFISYVTYTAWYINGLSLADRSLWVKRIDSHVKTFLPSFIPLCPHLCFSLSFSIIFGKLYFREGKIGSERGRERQKRRFVVPLVYAITGWFLHLPWPGRDLQPWCIRRTLTNSAIQPGLAVTF